MITKNLINRANEKLNNDLCLFEIIGTIHKLKAAISILIGNDKETIEKVHLEYFKNATVYRTDASEKLFDDHKTLFQKFLESDERDMLTSREYSKKMKNNLLGKLTSWKDTA